MKRLLKRLFPVGLALAFVAGVQANGTIDSLSINSGEDRVADLVVYTVSWTSDAASGDVDATLNTARGTLVRVVSDPAAGGDAPSANYDVYLRDVDALEIINTQGENRHTSTTEDFIPTGDAITFQGPVTLRIENAGTSNKGLLRFYVRPW